MPTTTLTRTEGHLRLRAERVGARTRLTELECRAPLQVLRTHYLDPALPDMAYVTVVSPSGGVLQGDRLSISADVGPGARLHMDTPSATRLYRMPDAEAQQAVELSVESGGYLEYLPEPSIPFAGSRFAGLTRCTVAEDATLILSELVTAGRAARGEIHRFERFEQVVEIGRPGDEPLAVDATILEPADGLTAQGRLGRYLVTGALYVIRAAFDPDALRAAVAVADALGVYAGVSTLPAGAGAWLRVLAMDSASAGEALGAAVATARREILGALPPTPRRP